MAQKEETKVVTPLIEVEPYEPKCTNAYLGYNTPLRTHTLHFTIRMPRRMLTPEEVAAFRARDPVVWEKMIKNDPGLLEKLPEEGKAAAAGPAKEEKKATAPLKEVDDVKWEMMKFPPVKFERLPSAAWDRNRYPPLISRARGRKEEDEEEDDEMPDLE